MLALVVGGNGFLGSHLVTALLERGFAVRVYSRRPASPHADPVQHVSGDVQERDLLRRALDGVDYVFHFAWTTVPQTSNENPAWDVTSNLTAGLGLLDACREAGVRAVVFPSSGGTVYGTADCEALDETCPTEPICSYGITKLALEKYLALHRRQHGLDYRVLRIANAYGEGQRVDRPQGLIGAALVKVARDEPIEIWGDGSVVRDYIYAGDVAECVLRAALAPLDADAPRVFNVGSGRGHSVRDVLTCVEAVTGRRVPVRYTGGRKFDADRVVLSSDRARQLLDWSPRVSLPEGLRRTWEWVRNTFAR
jgi:UDP-glucose 4-epimerase